MKLSWSTKNGKLWEADFWRGSLTLRIDHDRDTCGIYDGEDVVFETTARGDDWQYYAEKLEEELSLRLLDVSHSLDTTPIDPVFDEPLCCDVCGNESTELHAGYYEGDQARCPPCLREFEAKVVAEYLGQTFHPPALIQPEKPTIMEQALQTLRRGDSVEIVPVNEAHTEVAKQATELVRKYYEEVKNDLYFLETPASPAHEIKSLPPGYWMTYRLPEKPSTQVEDAIKAEAATVKL